MAPLLVFGETDPGARLTVSRDLSTHVAVAVSTDLTDEGRQIYLLDLHDFRRKLDRSVKVVGVTGTPLGVWNVCSDLIVAPRSRDLQDDGLLAYARWGEAVELGEGEIK